MTETKNVIEVTGIIGSKNRTTIPLGNLKTLADRETTPPGFALWRVLTASDGDKRIVWDTTDFAQMRDAKELFDQCIAAGMVPYICDDQGRPTGEVMSEFDPTSGEVVFTDVVFAPSRLAVGG